MKIRQTPLTVGQPPSVPPMYFQSFTLGGVKGFRSDTVFSFADTQGRPHQWTIVLGENGMGKTTLLQCLAGMSVRPGVMRKKDGTQSPVLESYWSGGDWLTWHLQRLNDPSRPYSCRSTLTKGVTLANKKRPITQQWEFGLELKPRQNSEVHVGVTANAAPPKEMAGFLVYAYGAGRKMAINSRVAFESSPADAVRTIFDDDKPLMNAEDWLLELDHLSKTDHPGKSKAQQQYSEIQDLLVRVLPGVEKTRVRVNSGNNGPATVGVEFKTQFAWVDIARLSHGYQTMASWLVDLTRRLYQRYPESSNPIAEPAIVLIDEIDLHLHPRWQQTVIDYLSERFTNTQFIVTAHSPLIIQSAKTANIILLQCNKNEIEARQDLDSIRNWRVDQILTSDLFGLERTRPLEIEKLYDERSDLLSKPNLGPSENGRLKELNLKIHSLPSSDSESMRSVELLLKKVAAEHTQSSKK